MFACRLLLSGCYIKQVSVEYILESWQAIRNLAFCDASLIMQSHALVLLIGECMEIIIQSIPEKNLVVEFYSRRSEIATKGLNWKGS